MGLGDRISGWVEERRAAWGDALGTWLLDRIAGGATKFIDDLEPGLRDQVRDSLTNIKNMPGLPEDQRKIIEQALEGPGAIQFAALLPFLIGLMVAFGFGAARPAMNLGAYQVDKRVHSFRMDPFSVINAWRRDPEKYNNLFDDLRDQGWSDARIEALQFFTEFLPNADEQTLWLAREVFEPDQVIKYGLDDELPDYGNTDFSKIGVNPEQMRNKWRAHWQHSSYIQMVEMFRRKLITKQDFSDWFRLVEIAPFWRDNLIEISQAWPTRVDVRRWWDMRTIDESRLRQLYQGMGYEGQNLEDYVLWTKVFTEFPSLLARWSKGWITLEELRARTLALGMPAERVETFIQEKIEAEKPERTSKERDITKTDIYKGVKQERISRVQGLELLQDLGYDEDEADYLLSINIPQDQVESVANTRLLTKSDVIAGLRTGVLSEDEARERLLEIRYSAVDAQLLLDIFKASIAPPKEPRLREESKADIVKAVKKGLLDREEGYLMLIDIGFDPTAADFILFVNVEESPFSPVDFGEFKAITSKWRKASGMTTPEFTAKIREARDELIRITDEIKLLEDSVRVEELTLVDQDVIPDETKGRLDELNVALNRARSEKDRLQRDFDALVAEFRQTEGPA